MEALLLAAAPNAGAGSGAGGSIWGLLFLIVHIYCVVWAYRDAERRGKPGTLVALMVFVAPLLGVLLWIIFRPEGRYRR